MERVPLFRRDGSVCAHALVDDCDYHLVGIYRWSLSDKGYAQRSITNPRRITIKMHREILGLVPGDGLQGDHINRENKLDNRRSNLRIATPLQNSQNRSPNGDKTYRGKPTSSQFRNVSWNRFMGQWQVYLHVKGKNIFIGRYDDEEEANKAAVKARLKYMPWSVS